jgi:hypothetical protein
MKSMNERRQIEEPRPAAALTPAPRERFRIKKLEERIAPRGRWGPRGTNKWCYDR